MRVTVRVIELCGPLQLPEGLHGYDGVRLYYSLRGHIKGYTTVWNSHKNLAGTKFRFPDDFGNWLLLSNVLFSPLTERQLDPAAIKKLLCAKIGLRFEDLDEDWTPPSPESLPPLTVSLILPTHDRPDELARTLEHLTRHETRVRHEIIVVDNNPASGLTRPVVERSAGVRYVEETRQGRGHACNTGALAARGDLVLIGSDSLVAGKGWLDWMVAPFADPEVDAVVGLNLPDLEGHSPAGLEEIKQWAFDLEARAWKVDDLVPAEVTRFFPAVFRYTTLADSRVGPFEVVPELASLEAEQLYRVMNSGRQVFYQPQAHSYSGSADQEEHVSLAKAANDQPVEKRAVANLFRFSQRRRPMPVVKFAENLASRVPLTGPETVQVEPHIRRAIEGERLDICFVSTQYPPDSNFGGIGTFVHTAARMLARRGHKVSVVSISREHEESRKIVDGVHVWRYHEPVQRGNLKDDARRNWQVWRAIQEIRPQVIQLQEYEAEGFLVAQLANKQYGLVTRLTDHATLTKARYEDPFNFRREVLSYLALRQVQHCHALYSPSIRLARQIEQDAKLKPGSVRQIVTGVNLDEIAQLREAEPCVKVDEPYIIYFGRVEERKGVTYLAQALPAVWEKFPDLKVMFAGLHSIYSLEGKPAKEYIEAIAGKYAKNLIFTDYLSREDVLPLVARAKLAVLPSIWEPYAHTCIEAITLGVPVVTTGDSGGNAEIISGVDDEEVEPGSVPAGWLVPRQNPSELAKAVIKALSDEEEYARIYANVQRRAKRFDAERMICEIEALYREIYQKVS